MNRVGIFGGTFNPLHIGHINSMLTALKEASLEKIYVVPSFQSPAKEFIKRPYPKERLEMLKAGLKGYESILQVDSQEIQRAGVSYTIDTLEYYCKKYSSGDIFLILGADVFNHFDTWKKKEEIIRSVNLIVTSRSRTPLPLRREDLPRIIQKHIADFDKRHIMLDTNRFIQFVRLDDIDISSSEVRSKLRMGQKVEKFLNCAVEDYIKKHHLYTPPKSQWEDFYGITRRVAQILDSKKAIQLRVFDLRNTDVPTDYTIISSFSSQKAASSNAELLIRALKEELGLLPLSVDGLQGGRWVAVDYGGLIIHIFYDYVRAEYHLEELWDRGTELFLL